MHIMHYSHKNSLIHRSLTGFGLNQVHEFTVWDLSYMRVHSHASALGEFVETRYAVCSSHGSVDR